MFVGTLIGRGEASHNIAEVYKTTSGKYVASLIEADPYGSSRKHSGIVSDDAAGIAAFFEHAVETGTGETRVTRMHLNEAGKLAMQNASAIDGAFLDKGFEIVE